MAERPWTKSQRQALPFILSAVTKGMKSTHALEEYRAGGGRIATRLWSEAWHPIWTMHGWAEDVAKIHPAMEIPRRMFLQVPADYKQQYVLRAEVRYYHKEEKRWKKGHITVESDELLTRRDWWRKIEEQLLEDSPPGYDPERGFTVIKALTEKAAWAK